jgi:tetratricopeptide (TPR) repeat protein
MADHIPKCFLKFGLLPRAVTVSRKNFGMKNYLKPYLLFAVVVSFFLIACDSSIPSKKKEPSKISQVPVNLPYAFKSGQAEKLSAIAFKLRKEGQFDQSIKVYREAIQVEHDNPRLFFDLSESYAKVNKLSEAIFCLDSAIILDSSYAGFYSNRGLLYYHLNANANAIADFKKSIRLNNHNYVYYANLSIVYYSVNRLEEACLAFKHAKMLGMDIDNFKEQRELNELQKLCN